MTQLSISPIAKVGDPLSRHLELVSAVCGFAAPPSAWDELVTRLRDFRAQAAGASPMRDALIDAIVGGGADAARISELRALAEAEAMPINPTLMQIVQGAVQAELFAIYEPTAPVAYSAVAQAFNAAAGKFATCASKCDPEADSEAVVHQSGPTRTAWIDALGHAGRLDELLVLLVAAAELAGVMITRDEELVPLVIANADDLHRRRLWEAFDSAKPVASQGSWVSRREIANQWTPPRCGRWSALATLGAVVEAADLAEELEPYRRPAPLDRRQYPVKGQPAMRVEVYDPEDADYRQQLERGHATAAS
jgi:hypothetical protein